MTDPTAELAAAPVATSADEGGARRIVGSTRTPGDLRPRRALGDGVRSARSFAFDVALPSSARTEGPEVRPAALPDGVLPTGRGVAAEAPAMPQTGALAAYAALLARKVKPPRDVPVRGLPLVVRRGTHSADELRLPGSIVASLVIEDAKVAPNAARAPRRTQRPAAPGGAPQPAPAAPQPQPRTAAPRRADARAPRAQTR